MRRRGGICYYDICLLEQLLRILKPYFVGSAWTSPADGKQRINILFSFASVHHLHFCFIKLPLS